MMNKDNDTYGSIEEQSLTFGGESSSPVQDTTRSKEYSVKTIAAAATLFGLFAGLGLSSISRANVAANVSLLSSTAQGSNVALPDYVTALYETDPEWDASRLTSKWVIGDPGKGNLLPDEVALVKFVKPHFVFRTYGGEGKASQCGYWWTLNPPQEDKDTYFDHFAICPEWNDASEIIRCRVPAGYVAVVGVGQTVDCPTSGGHLAPQSSNLQLSGDVCSASIKMEQHLSCEYCSSNTFDLGKSACSNKGPSYIDGFEFSG